MIVVESAAMEIQTRLRGAEEERVSLPRGEELKEGFLERRHPG